MPIHLSHRWFGHVLLLRRWLLLVPHTPFSRLPLPKSIARSNTVALLPTPSNMGSSVLFEPMNGPRSFSNNCTRKGSLSFTKRIVASRTSLLSPASWIDSSPVPRLEQISRARPCHAEVRHCWLQSASSTDKVSRKTRPTRTPAGAVSVDPGPPATSTKLLERSLACA